ncbi:DUF1003 domain-containing protein [Fibrella aquatilis]|nr:DUF1003 domain-containing protein [Fibrella aquatilis]
MDNSLYVRCDISGDEVVIEAAIPGSELHPRLLAEIKADFPNFKPESYISLNRLMPYVNRAVDRVQLVPAGQQLTAPPDVDANLTLGQRLADKIADFGGSWTFILTFLGVMVSWIGLNAWIFANRGFDPYPFILLNLVLSCLAALQAPVIMMSQNRQEERDRERARQDYEVNLKAESEIRLLQQKVDMLLQKMR